MTNKTISRPALSVLCWIRDNPHSHVDIHHEYIVLRGYQAARSVQRNIWDEAFPYMYETQHKKTRRIKRRFCYPNPAGMVLLTMAGLGKRKPQMSFRGL